MRFIISTDAVNVQAASRNSLTAFLEGKGWSVWHWFQDLWLVDSAEVQVDAVAFRDEILKAVPGLPYLLILSGEGTITHAGMVPVKAVEWFVEHWSINRVP